MNNGYLIKDGLIKVINEKGEIISRPLFPNVEEILQLENNIENVENTLEKNQTNEIYKRLDKNVDFLGLGAASGLGVFTVSWFINMANANNLGGRFLGIFWYFASLGLIIVPTRKIIKSASDSKRLAKIENSLLNLELNKLKQQLIEVKKDHSLLSWSEKASADLQSLSTNYKELEQIKNLAKRIEAIYTKSFKDNYSNFLYSQSDSFDLNNFEKKLEFIEILQKKK